MNADGTNPTQLTDHPRPDVDPAWSPDGTQIAFESSRIFGSDIFVINDNGTNHKNELLTLDSGTQNRRGLRMENRLPLHLGAAVFGTSIS